MDTRTFFLVICTMCLTSGCALTSPLASSGTALLDGRNSALNKTPITSGDRPRIDTTSAKFKVMHAYQFSVSKKDGVNEEEAKVIAQSEVIFRGFENDYYFTRPRIHDVKPNKWTVEFYPITKTFREARVKPRVRVTVDKEDGHIKWDYQI